MRTVLHLGSIISLLRIPLAVAFLVAFDLSNFTSLIIAATTAILAQVLDHLDGWITRRVSQPSLEGWLFDSVSDRAFYIAAILAFGREYGIPDLLVWAAVLREVSLYAVRISVGDFSKRLPQSRTLALIHAGLIRIAIALGSGLPLIFGLSTTMFVAPATISALLLASILLGFLTLWRIARQ